MTFFKGQSYWISIYFLFFSAVTLLNAQDTIDIKTMDIQKLVRISKDRCGYSEGSDAMSTLGRTRSPEALATIIELFQKRHPVKESLQKVIITGDTGPAQDCRVTALMVLDLNFSSDPKAIKVLESAQSDSDETVRRLAISFRESRKMAEKVQEGKAKQ